MDDAFEFELPLWRLKSEDSEKPYCPTIECDGGVKAYPMFTDEDLARRFIFDNGYRDFFQPVTFEFIDHVLIWLDYLEKEGLTHVVLDPKRTIARVYTIEQFRIVIERTQDSPW